MMDTVCSIENAGVTVGGVQQASLASAHSFVVPEDMQHLGITPIGDPHHSSFVNAFIYSQETDSIIMESDELATEIVGEIMPVPETVAQHQEVIHMDLARDESGLIGSPCDGTSNGTEAGGNQLTRDAVLPSVVSTGLSPGDTAGLPIKSDPTTMHMAPNMIKREQSIFGDVTTCDEGIGSCNSEIGLDRTTSEEAGHVEVPDDASCSFFLSGHSTGVPTEAAHGDADGEHAEHVVPLDHCCDGPSAASIGVPPPGDSCLQVPASLSDNHGINFTRQVHHRHSQQSSTVYHRAYRNEDFPCSDRHSSQIHLENDDDSINEVKLQLDGDSVVASDIYGAEVESVIGASQPEIITLHHHDLENTADVEPPSLTEELNLSRGARSRTEAVGYRRPVAPGAATGGRHSRASTSTNYASRNAAAAVSVASAVPPLTTPSLLLDGTSGINPQLPPPASLLQHVEDSSAPGFVTTENGDDAQQPLFLYPQKPEDEEPTESGDADTHTSGYSCMECGAVLKSKAAAKKHLIQVHNYQCTSKRKHLRQQHQALLAAQQQLRSPVVAGHDTSPSLLGSSSNIAGSIDESFSTVVGAQLYQCPSCAYSTTRRDKLDKHVMKHVLQDGYHPCGKKRHRPEAPPQRHRHNAEEYHCPYCPYGCTVYKALRKHKKLHLQGKAVVGPVKISCKVCGKDRNSEEEMTHHMRKHRQGDNFVCDICGFTSIQLKKIIQHRRMHTGEKPHLCPHCSYRSARRDNLRSHVRRMHKRDNMYIDTFNPNHAPESVPAPIGTNLHLTYPTSPTTSEVASGV